MTELSIVTISLSPPHPTAGGLSKMVRMTGNDFQILETAAQSMGWTASQLMRVLLVRGSERILRELGVEIDYIQNENVDASKGETFVD